MRRILLITALGFSLITCSQKNKQDIEKNEEIMNTDIRKDFVNYLKSQVIHYDKEPVWFFWIDNKTDYEILVNDFPIEKFYEEGGLGNRITFNQAILKSGQQEFTLRIFPKNVDNNESYNYKIIIGRYFKSNKHKSEELEEIKLSRKDFIKAGENFYETKYKFDAEVPYENEGWSKGQDLTKFDSVKLEDFVLKKYQSLAKMILDKKEEDFLNQMKYGEGEMVRAKYSEIEEIEGIYDYYNNMFFNNSYELQPIENYNMVFYGNGKMVALIQKSYDLKLRGESAFWAKYIDNGNNYGDFTRIILYLPQGKSLEDGLEIIR